MRPSDWVRDRIEAMTRHHNVVWVEDPYRLLGDVEVSQVRSTLARSGHELVVVNNALRLRENLDTFTVKRKAKVVIIDNSYTLRDPHLLPKDAKPSDLRPLRAPDWKPQLPADAIFRPNIRDFLISTTGFEDWPGQVNIYPYEKLARERPVELVRAYETFRRMGRSLTDDDLVIVGASAVLGVDLFEITNPLVAVEIAFHAGDRWTQLADLFNWKEQDVIRRHLRGLSRPLGDLFGDNAELARLAVIALLVIKQHPPFDEAPGKQLPFLSTALAAYSDCDTLPCPEVPAWFIECEIPLFEKSIGGEFLRYIRQALELEDTEKARAFAQRERLSQKLRSLVPFEIQTPDSQHEPMDDFRLEHLVPEFLQFKHDLENIVRSTRPIVENLRLIPLKNQKLAQFCQIFVDRGLYRVDRLVGRLENLIYFVEGPARRQWQQAGGFEERWAKEVRACRDLMTLAGRLRDDLDLAFGKLMEARYSELIPAEVFTTNLFYEKFIAPRRRTGAGQPEKAIVIVVDSMRFDIWRELVRPALERDYDVEESLGFALLPSETRVSRRGFFAGKPPGLLPASGRESEMFAELLSSIHGTPVTFEELPYRRPGMAFAVRTRDSAVHAAVFDFPDVLSHEVNWDPHTLQEGQRPLIREIRALLDYIGSNALVFITADHGHILQERGAAVWIENADDVGYRSAYVRSRIEGSDGAALFQIPARTLGHGQTGWYVFPRPGRALRNAADRTRPFRPTATYRHGGLSLFEVVVPLVCLRHRGRKAHVRLAARTLEPLIVGQASNIEVSITADSLLASPVSLSADDAAVEASVISGISNVPQSVRLRFVPSAPGRQSLRIAAQLAGETVGETMLDLQVETAAPTIDAAKAKLMKLFGEE